MSVACWLSVSARPTCFKSNERGAEVIIRDLLIVIIIVLIPLTLVAWILAVSKFAEIAKAKGHSAGEIWFIGLFATPIVAGLLTAQLPIIAKGSTKCINEDSTVNAQPQNEDEAQQTAQQTLEQRRENARKQYEISDNSTIAKYRYNAQLQYVDKSSKE